MIDGEHQKVTIAKISDSMIVGYTHKVSSIELPISTIDTVRERKFSLIKSIALPVVITGGIITLFLVALEPTANIGSPNFY